MVFLKVGKDTRLNEFLVKIVRYLTGLNDSQRAEYSHMNF